MKSWYFSQIGRREHYAIPKSLHQEGILKAFFTDFWAGSIPFRGFIPTRFANRYDASLDINCTSSLPLFKNIELSLKRFQSTYDRWVAIGESFGHHCCQAWRPKVRPPCSVIAGYTCGNLEQIRLAKDTGSRALHIQIDPGLEWYQVRERAQSENPEVEEIAPMPTGSFLSRIEEEIRQCDVLIAHSQHTLDSLNASNTNHPNSHVVPPFFIPPILDNQLKPNRSQQLTIAYLGQKCVAKGFHVFVEVAKRLRGKCLFRAAGTNKLKKSYFNYASKFIEMEEQLSKHEAERFLSTSDILIFPTLSDGFGLVQLEAMSRGLPVIATPNCGQVVMDSVNGFVVPANSVEPIAHYIETIDRDRDLLQHLSEAAVKRSSEFHPKALLPKLLNIAEDK